MGNWTLRHLVLREKTVQGVADGVNIPRQPLPWIYIAEAGWLQPRPTVFLKASHSKGPSEEGI